VLFSFPREKRLFAKTCLGSVRITNRKFVHCDRLGRTAATEGHQVQSSESGKIQQDKIPCAPAWCRREPI
jgi:hypothetical protein